MNKLKNIQNKVLSNEWATLNRIDYDFQFNDGSWKRISRESYDRGDGACVLLYNKEKSTIILTKQFRMPAYANNKNDGMSIEVCAGAIDNNEAPEVCIIREVEEEVGYKIPKATKVLEAYTSPGAVTEKMFLFVAEYTDAMQVNEGGGLASENEEIEVIEVSFAEAIEMMNNQTIMDAKTIMLLQYAQINNLFIPA
ncbi:NUDIX domain-containing protein [Lacinutrix gracilariae]|uniref:GDP-mannose pyrophosphatase n=1 Tax=Lacinutrix gracilariae TaxID=1747198 RepID=A0ABW5K195_9FLAO